MSEVVFFNYHRGLYHHFKEMYVSSELDSDDIAQNDNQCFLSGLFNLEDLIHLNYYTL